MDTTEWLLTAAVAVVVVSDHLQIRVLKWLSGGNWRIDHLLYECVALVAAAPLLLATLCIYGAGHGSAAAIGHLPLFAAIALAIGHGVAYWTFIRKRNPVKHALSLRAESQVRRESESESRVQ